MKYCFYSFLLLSILQMNAVNSVAQNYTANCEPGRFYLMGSGDIHAFRLVNNTIQYDGVAVPSLNGSGLNALAISTLDGTPKFFSSSGTSILKLENDWQVIYTSTNEFFSNGAGNGKNLFFDAFTTFNAAIQRFNGTAFETIIPSFNLGVADMAVDDDGNLYYFDNPNNDNNLLLKVVSPVGNQLASYPISLNTNNAYGLMLMNNVLYIAFGSVGIYPNSLLPITLTESTATMGAPIPLPLEASFYSFIDMATCASARVPFNCMNGPAAPTVKVTQPDCTNSTGSVEITSPISKDILYSLSNAAYNNKLTYGPLSTGTYNIIAQDTSSKCVSKGTSVFINAHPATPAIPLLTVTQPACPVITGTIQVDNNNTTGLLYNINGGEYTNTSGVFNNLIPGTYLIRASNGNCTSANATAVVNPTLALQLNLSASPSLAEIGKPITLTLTGNTEFSVISWEPAAAFQNQTATTQNIITHNTDQFYAIGKTPGGCLDTAYLSIITNTPTNVFVPNAFSPNDDNRNDIFYVYGKGINKFKLSIWNRLGENVFNSSRQDIGWDGNYRGKAQPIGAYVYLLVAIGIDNKEVIRKGTITLVK